MLDYTLCFPLLSEDRVLLGMKRRGHGLGYLNGFGGKIKDGETFKQAAVRELQEECGLIANPEKLLHVADIEYVFSEMSEYDCIIHAFTVSEFDGVIRDSDEMTTFEFDIDNIIYNNMREEDRVWIPYILRGRKIYAKFCYEKDESNVSWFSVSLTE